jgi:hypothetical protein
VRERKNVLIKYNILRDINSTRRDIQTLKPFMQVTVAKEDTLFGAKGKLLLVVGTQIRPTGTPKHTKRGIIWLCME